MGIDLWVWAVWELDPQGPPEPAGNTAWNVDTHHGTRHSMDCGYTTWNKTQHGLWIHIMEQDTEWIVDTHHGPRHSMDCGYTTWNKTKQG